MTSTTTTKPTFIARMMSKPDLQALLRAVRKDDNASVIKLDGGYEVTSNVNGELILKAMNGQRDYLCRLNKRFFVV
jgi:hypothetical protein